MTQMSLKAVFILGALILIIATLNGVDASVRRLERDDVTGHVGSTREEVLATRERRKAEIRQRLESLYGELEEYTNAGYSTEKLKKKVMAYEAKLEHLNAPFDDRVSSHLLLPCIFVNRPF